MPKKIIQDVIASHDNSIERDQEAVSKSAAESEFGTIKDTRGIDSSPIFERMKQKQEGRESLSQEFSVKPNFPNRILAISGVVLVFILAGSFAYSLFWGGVSIAIQPKTKTVSLSNTTIVITNSTSTGPGTFQVMSLSAEEFKDIPSNGEKFTEKKSFGKIVIKNEFGTDSQRLVKNTRFQSKEGKIYRIADSVTVPGMKKSSSGNIPGELEVTVYADFPGKEYDVGLTDFTIPGFKGTPRYEKFSARSKTPIAGGFQGNMKVVTPADLLQAKQDLENSLTDILTKKALVEKPQHTVFWNNIGKWTFEDRTEDGVNGMVKEVVKGTFSVVLFDSRVLSRLIAHNVISLTPEDIIDISNIDTLQAELKDEQIFETQDLPDISLTLNGNPVMVWEVDISELKKSLLGIKKSEYSDVFSKFTGIEKAQVSFSPFWKRRFPNNPNDIAITLSTNEIENSLDATP